VNASDIALLVRGMAPAIRDAVATAVDSYDAVWAPRIVALEAEIARLKAMQPVHGLDGKDGAPGERGLDGAPGRDGVDGAPGPPGRDGAKGPDGVAGRDGLDGKDGRDGVDGAPGAPGRDGAKGLDGVAGRDGLDGKDGRDGLPGVPGRDGEKGLDGANGRDGANGADGLGFDDMTEELADDGRTIIRRYSSGDRVKEFRHTFSVVLDRGVFSAGKSYEPGDAVTWGGSLFIAQKATSAKPGEASDASRAWRLAVKRGGDGKQGPAGPQGERGAIGPQGPQGRAAY